MCLDPCEMLPQGPLVLMPRESDLLLSPMALDHPTSSPPPTPAQGPWGWGGWSGRQAGWQGREGCISGNCVGEAHCSSLEQAARVAAGLWGMPPASPKCCLWGRELGPGQGYGLGWGLS